MRVDTCSDLAAVSIGRPSRRPESCLIGMNRGFHCYLPLGTWWFVPSVLSLAGGWGQVRAELASEVSALTKPPSGGHWADSVTSGC